MITIYTDGSSRGNPGPGGWGVVVLSDNDVSELGGHEDHTTNNRMELMAAIKALEFVKGGPITLYTDSEYVMKGITLWIKGWQAKGWKTAAKKPVLNQDLWQELLRVSEWKEISWKYVAGHSGEILNERCDEIATSFADQAPVELYNGARQTYPIIF
jgi:ribonuclease HI